jgi:hypothetical protein
MIPRPELEMLRPLHGPDSLAAVLRWRHDGDEYGAQQSVSIAGSGPPTEAFMARIIVQAFQLVIDEYVKWINDNYGQQPKTKTKYRLVVKRHDREVVYPMPSEDRAYERLGCWREEYDEDRVWLEASTVTEWEKIDT